MQATNIVKSKIYAPDLPWNVFSPDDLGPCVMGFVRDHESFFRRWADTWYENFQFLYGNHQLKWSRKLGIAVDHDFLRRGAGQSLRSQTNLARVVAEALGSLIYSSLPTWAVQAMDSSNVRGKRFKKIVEKILECYMERLNMDKEFAAAAMIYVVFGQVAWKIDWNFSGGKLLEIPRFRKQNAPVYTTYMAPNPYTGGLIETPVPALDSGGQPVFEERWEAVVDATGRQIIDRFFAGDVKVDTLTPFEYRRELGSAGMHKTKWVQQVRLLDFDDYLDEYGDLDGKTKHFEGIRPIFHDETIWAFAVRHFMRMQYTTPPSVDDGFRRAQSVLKSSLFKHKVFVVEHYDRPHPKKWPLGRRLVIANGACTHVLTPSYHTNKLDGWHPFVESQWMTVQPSSIASGPMNDVIRKNRELDVKDSLIATAVRRNMGSKLLFKVGSGLDPQKFTGEPGEAHECHDPYAVRWLHDDMPIPPVISVLRQNDKEDVYETSGAMDALRGDRSKGASSGYALKQLEEREEKRLTPARKNFEYGVSGVGEKLFTCLKANVAELGDDVMGYLMRAAAGEFTAQDVVAMLSASIDFGVDIKVTKSSMALKSKATEEATMLELAQSPPVTQRLSTDARTLDKFLDTFGVKVLRDGSSVHRDRVDRENEVFLDIMRLGPNMEGLERPVVLYEDDDNIHLAYHGEFFIQNAEDFFKNEVALQEYLVHMERHRIQDQEKQGAAAAGMSLQVPQMMAAARQQPPPGMQQSVANTQVMQQNKAQAESQAPKPAGQAPQAPRGAKTSPGQPGPRPQNPAAPSGNTQTAKSGGPTNAA